MINMLIAGIINGSRSVGQSMNTNVRTVLTAANLLGALAFCAVALLPITGCNAKSQSSSIIGKWVGNAPNGDKITYVFKDDNTVIWTVDAIESPGSISAKYTVDYTFTPIHIDIFEFNIPALQEFIFLGVLDFDGSSRFRLFGEHYKVGGGTIRPLKLGNDAISFFKVH